MSRYLWRVESREKGSKTYEDWQLVRHFMSARAAQHRAVASTTYSPELETRILRSQPIEFEDATGSMSVTGYYRDGVAL